MQAQGESATSTVNLPNTGAMVVIDVETAVRQDSSFARSIQLYNFGPDAIEISYGNGSMCSYIPVAAGQPYDAGGPVTKLAMRAAPAVSGARVTYELKVAGGK